VSALLGVSRPTIDRKRFMCCVMLTATLVLMHSVVDCAPLTLHRNCCPGGGWSINPTQKLLSRGRVVH
jgi:hypothetical protein